MGYAILWSVAIALIVMGLSGSMGRVVACLFCPTFVEVQA